jgi:hypothetical protein
MPSDEIAVLIDEKRHGPTPLAHARRDLRDLTIAVDSGIAGIRHQPLDRPSLNRIGGPLRH